MTKFILAGLLVLCACTNEEPRKSEPESKLSATATVSASAAPLATVSGPGPSATPKLDVMYKPTPEHVVDEMLKLAKVKKTDLVYDLGCGDGRIVVTAAKKYGVRAVGYDIDPERVAEAKQNVKQAGVENLVTIEQADVFTLDLSKADVVTLYLLPELNVRLIPQLEKLKPGSRVVSYAFHMEGVKPAQHMWIPGKTDPKEHQIFLWNVPLEKI